MAQMYGRKITPGLREGTPLHLYLPGEHRAVWNVAGLRAGGGQKEWLLCESIIDALTLWCAGFRNVTCAYGVNGFTEAHWKLIEEVKPRRIVLCYDNDEAGNRAAAKLAEELRARGIIVVRSKLPAGCKDINDVACWNKDARVALAIALETPVEIVGMDGPVVPTPSLVSPPPASSEAAKEKTLLPPDIVTAPRTPARPGESPREPRV